MRGESEAQMIRPADIQIGTKQISNTCGDFYTVGHNEWMHGARGWPELSEWVECPARSVGGVAGWSRGGSAPYSPRGQLSFGRAVEDTNEIVVGPCENVTIVTFSRGHTTISFESAI